MGLPSLALLALLSFPSAWSGEVSAEGYKLSENPFLRGCPFLHDDHYDFTGLLGTLKSQLQEKIEGNAKCQAPFLALQSGLEAVSNSLAKTKSEQLRAELERDGYRRYLDELYRKKLEFEESGTTSDPLYATLTSRISSNETALAEAEIDLALSEGKEERERKTEYQRELFDYSRDFVTLLQFTMASRPECLSELGPQILAPALLNVSSLAAGASGIRGGDVFAAIGQIASGIVGVFSDRSAKNAFSDLNDFRNRQILACTYYAFQSTSCGYRRALRISERIDELDRLIEEKYSSHPRGEEYAALLKLTGLRTHFSRIFSTIARIGSGFTLDTTELKSYFDALRVDPANLPPAPELSTPPTQEQLTRAQLWLTEVRSRGVTFSDANYSTGEIYSVPERVANAKKDITNRMNIISAMNVTLTERRSFTDLKSQIESDSIFLRRNIRDLRAFLAARLVDPDFNPFAGPVHVLGNALQRLDEFLSVQVTPEAADGTEPPKSYEDRVNQAGSRLFNEMARGSVAQLNSQTVLLVGGKMDERLEAAFRAIQNFYIDRDLREGAVGDARFLAFYRDHSSLAEAYDRLELFRSNGLTSRRASERLFAESFARGFRDEVVETVQTALTERKSQKDPRSGQDAAHFCALYAPILKFLDEEDLLAECRRKAKKIDLFSKKPFPIDYSNECAYADYQLEDRIEKTEYQIRRLREGWVR